MWRSARVSARSRNGWPEMKRVHHDAHHQRLVPRRLPHLVELVDDHVGEVARRGLPPDHRGTVVQFQRVGQRQQPARLGVVSQTG